MDASGQPHTPAAIFPGQSKRHQLNRSLGASRIRYGRFGDEIYLLSMLGFEHVIIQPLACVLL
jgi:hypothetical protein